MFSKNEADASGFVLVTDLIPDAVQEIRYFSTFNFVGERIDGYEQPVALMTKESAEALKKCSNEFRAMGYCIKIFDTYRPQAGVDRFVRWGEDQNDVSMKPYFYPEVDKKDVMGVYVAFRSSHSRGSTVDLTLINMVTGMELDMGGQFDYFGERSHPFFEDVTEEQHANRMLLREVMLRNGFMPYDSEWWHFTLAEEPYPDTYFTFPVSENSVKRL